MRAVAPWVFAAGLVVAFTVGTAAPAFFTPGPPLDEGMLPVLPELVRAGALPHRDFEWVYTPGSLWLLAGAYAVAGPSVAMERRSEPGARVFVGPRDLRRTNYNDVFLYFLLPHLVPATRYIYMDPGLADRSEGRLVRDIAAADLLLLTEDRKSVV